MSEATHQHGAVSGLPARNRSAALAVREARDLMGVFLLDEHPLFRTGVRSVMEDSSVVRIDGEAATGEEALDALRDRTHRHPDVILADLPSVGMPMDEFVGLLTELSDHGPVRVLVVASAASDDAVIDAMRAGAYGFLRKNTNRDELLNAIHTVTSGGAVFGALIADRLKRYFTKVRRGYGPEVFPDLTSREREVLDLMVQGHPNRDIARRLHLAEKTVRNHVSHIFAKLHVTDRSAAMTRAQTVNPGTGLSI